MERLNLPIQPRHARHWLAWELRRGKQAFMRRFGGLGFLLLAAVLLGLLAWRVDREQRVAMKQAQAQLTQERVLRQNAPVRTVDAGSDDGRARLRAFDDYLLAHEDIPTLVQDLINQAEDEQLTLARGEYRPQMDVQGEFLRYRMTLPVKGDSQSILRFMQAALRKHGTLALESVQFKRERIESTDVEARLQWTVLTRAPAAASRAASALGAKQAAR